MMANMTEEEFLEIIQNIEDYYAPIVANQGGRLVIDKRWDDPTVNAYAQQSGRIWRVTMFGGLARRPEVTADGFALVVCRELGHHLGGWSYIRSWEANEGQSDYFATHVCAKNIWGSETATNATFRDTVDATAKASCDSAYADTPSRDLCYRSAMGGLSLARLLSVLGKLPEVSFDTPDSTVVTKTFNTHPKAQCRLDTYLNGALCKLQWNDDLIPGAKHRGMFGNKRKAELESIKYSCSQFNSEQILGERPKCWFTQTINEQING